MNPTRRNFLKNSTFAVSGAMVTPSLQLKSGSPIVERQFTIQDQKFKKLVQTAIDAAMSSGAKYADARLTHIYKFSGSAVRPTPILLEDMSFGVRALYDGYWGFAASPIWTTDEAARLGKAALRQAKINVLNGPRSIDFPAIKDLSSGHWTMPVKEDPFSMSFDEILDFLVGLHTYILQLPNVGDQARVGINCYKHEKAFGSSENQYTTQVLYSIDGVVSFPAKESRSYPQVTVSLETLSPAGMGFEYFRDQDLRGDCIKARDEYFLRARLPMEPVDVGRYNLLVHPIVVGPLLSQSIGLATQVDRVMGFEANATGTSYINDPLEMLDVFKLCNSMINVTGDRSTPGSVNRVKWDDEGVMPAKFEIVKDGILKNLQANREGASWIKDHLVKSQHGVQSYGCASSPSSLDVPLVYNSDLTLTPSNSQDTVESLRSKVEDGLELRFGRVTMDFQQVSGLGRGEFYKVKNGKQIARIIDAGILFRTPELWNNTIGLGGSDSVRRFGLPESKGEPAQIGFHSTYVPPVLFKEVTVIDPQKKA